MRAQQRIETFLLLISRDALVERSAYQSAGPINGGLDILRKGVGAYSHLNSSVICTRVLILGTK